MGRTRLWIVAGAAIALALGSWLLLVKDGRQPGTALEAGAGDRLPVARTALGPGNDIIDQLFQVDATVAPQHRAAGDSYPVTISRQAALAAGQTGTLTVALPDGTRYPVRYERSESAPDGNWTFFGRVDTPLGAQASVITFGQDAVFGILPTPSGETLKLTTRAGKTFLQPEGFSVPPGADPSRDLDYVLPGRPVPVASAAPGGAPAAQAAAVAMEPISIGQLADPDGGEVTITILAAYTRNLVELRGSQAAVETEYRNLLAIMNQAHVDSGTIARFEITAFIEVDYPAAEWNEEAIDDIRSNTLPDGTDLHGLRDQHAADLVSLIRPYVEDDLTCGISQFPGVELQAHGFSQGVGYSVTAVERCAPLVYAHEIGHNLGLMHDRDTVAGPRGATLRYGAYPFSFGHRQIGPPGFATVMAYDSESRPRLGYFSHPGTTLCGGDACGDAALADNVRTINAIAGSISRFRDPPGVIFIEDEWVLERDAGHFRTMAVRLSTPAPQGGVTFSLAVEYGTAAFDEDVSVAPVFLESDLVIEEGRTAHYVSVLIGGDEIAEQPESMTFRLKNVRGDVAVLDDEATLTIIDDDDTVHVEGVVRLPAGLDPLPESLRVQALSTAHGVTTWPIVYASPPDYMFSVDLPKDSLVVFQVNGADNLVMQDVIIEGLDRPIRGLDLELDEPLLFHGGMFAAGGEQIVGVPVILWNPAGDGGGYYVNKLPDLFVPYFGRDVIPGMAMQLEVRHPPQPYVRQVVEVPPSWAEGATDIQLREVPSLTIPHVPVREGTAADGPRTVLLTASLSVPGTESPVSFDIERHGTADGDDVQLPETRFTIPLGYSRIEVPVVISGDDQREADETLELRITNVTGPAWNPGPGSVRIISDDNGPEGGNCMGPTEPGAVRMCQ